MPHCHRFNTDTLQYRKRWFRLECRSFDLRYENAFQNRFGDRDFSIFLLLSHNRYEFDVEPRFGVAKFLRLKIPPGVALSGITRTLRLPLASEGQAIVEFTIAVILFIVVAWIPADFGLAFYTSQIAQNAAREGARIAAADSTLVAGNTSCNMPACYTFGNIFNETAARLPAALLTGASITVQYPAPASAGTCNQRVLVRVQGQYNFFFYRVLALLGVPVPTAVTVDRRTEMRWEHQSGCVGGATP